MTSKMQKNSKQLVNEYTQHKHMSPPQYHCQPESNKQGAHFFCSLLVGSQSFSTTMAYKTKKLAEMEASKLACFSLGLDIASTAPSSSSPVLPGERTPRSFHLAPTTFVNKTSMQVPPGAIVATCVEDVYKYLTDEVLAVLFKSLLHHHAQEGQKNYPLFKTEPATEYGLHGWTATVEFDGQTFNSLVPGVALYNPYATIPIKRKHSFVDQKLTSCLVKLNYIAYFTFEQSFTVGIMQTRKQAEQSAAEICLRNLGFLQQFTDEELFTIQKFKGGHSINSLPKKIPKVRACTNLLQVVMGQYSLQYPQYRIKEVPGEQYVGMCWFEGKIFESSHPSTSVAEARQTVAVDVLAYLGHIDTEEDTQTMNTIRFKKYRSYIPLGSLATPFSHAPSQQPCWVLTHYEDMLAFTGRDINDEDKKLVVEKQIHVTEQPDIFDMLLSREPALKGVPLADMKDLSISEVSFEDKDVVTLGNNEFSIRMYCENKMLYCRNRGRDVEIMPGHHVRGLKSHYRLCVPSLQVYLKAESCEDLFFPNPALPCVRSCFAVLLLYDHEARNKVSVLLKRTSNNQAFTQVSNTLATYFRRLVNGRLPCQLDVDSVTTEIDKWLTKDVRHLSEMTMDSMQDLFSALFKYDDRWNEIFVKQLPEDLSRLKNLCEIELSKRQAQADNSSSDDNRPWQLPKATFKHRMFNTGVFMEDSNFCLFHGIREQTGLKIKLGDIETSPVLDLPVSGNPNPHRGDVERYFVWSKVKNNSSGEEDTYYKDPELALSTPGEQWVLDEDAAKRSKINQKNRQRVKRKAEGDIQTSKEKMLKSDVVNCSITCDTSKTKEGLPSIGVTTGKYRRIIHDECRWFSLEDARKQCSVFDELFESQQVQSVLSKLQQDANEFFNSKCDQFYPGQSMQVTDVP